MYCIAAIVLLIGLLGHRDIYFIGGGIAQQLLVSVDHLGLSIPSYRSPEHNTDVHSGVRRPEPCG